MFCHACGTPLPPEASRCNKCEARVLSTPTQEVLQPALPKPPPTSRRTLARILIVAACLAPVLFVGGVLGFIKGGNWLVERSDAYRLAASTLKLSPAAAGVLGDGLTYRFKHASLGSDDASFLMLVQGSQGSGDYHAKLKRIDGMWKVTSAWLEIQDGSSVEIVLPPQTPLPTRTAPHRD